MKKIMFNVVSVVTALLVLVVMSSCGGGGGGGGSGASAGEQGEPSGTSTYAATAVFPYGFCGTGTGTLWVFNNNSNSALYFISPSKAVTLTRVGGGNIWSMYPEDMSYDVQITSGAQGYVRFSAPECWPSRYAYNVTDDVLILSNTNHGTKTYIKNPYDPNNPWVIQ
ncbi:MAG: hypothetical protein IKK38_11520 [Spirochaetaceae bacterium]|nr:hypothetical protein [Spirochaetaceae bacterium]